MIAGKHAPRARLADAPAGSRITARCGRAAASTPTSIDARDRGRRRRPLRAPRRSPVLEDGRVIGVVAGGETFTAPLTILAAGRAGRGGQAARRRARSRRAVRSGHPRLRRDAPPRRAPPRGMPVAARRARHAGPRLRLDVPGRRRHRQHRRRRAEHDEGLQEAQPEHAARSVRGHRRATRGRSVRTSTSPRRGGCR